MPEPLRLRVVVPAYNEAARLPAALAEMSEAVRVLPRFHLVEILVADNGSADDTALVARREAARLDLPLRVLACPERGKAAALVCAMTDPATSAGVDFVLFTDADGATPLAALAAFSPGPGEILVASRYAQGSRIIHPGGDPLVRRIMSAGMRGLTRRLFSLPLTDTQCGFKLLPADAVEPLFRALRDRSWIFDVELLALAARAGFRLREVPVTWTEMAGSSVDPLRDSVRSLIALGRIRLDLARRSTCPDRPVAPTMVTERDRSTVEGSTAR